MYEVVLISRGVERVLRTGIRRENGARNERDIAAMGAYRNALKHAEGDPTARVVRGPIKDDPNAEVVIYWDDIATIVTTVTYRKVAHSDDLTVALFASLIVIGVVPNA